jgi:DNA-binding beta-propeller fold protein YncE
MTTLRQSFAVLALIATGFVSASGQTAPTVKLVKSIPLAGYTGDFDHFAVDHDRDRLLVAAEDHATVEVFDLKTLAHLKTITGFGAPHSILARPGSKTVLITDSGKEMSAIRNANTLAVEKRVVLTPGADSGMYDKAANIYYVVTGGKDVGMKTAELDAINPDTGAKLGSIVFQDNHVEALDIDPTSNKLYINLTQTNKIAVVDRKAMKVLAVWPVPEAQQNAMVVIDPQQHRLYIVCRAPGKVVVLDSDNGHLIGTQTAPLRADQVQYDAAAHLLYVPGGEGWMGIYSTSDPNHLKLIEKVTTAPGAKTGLLLPRAHRLFLAASPGDTGAVAKLLVFDVN